MAQIIPIRELKDTAAISERCHNAGEPIFITKNGYGDMVVMSMDVYNRNMAMLDIYKALKEAENEMEHDAPTVPAEEFMAGLKEKYAKLSN